MENWGLQFISFWDWLLLPFYLIVIYIVASQIKNNKIGERPIYKYFITGLFAKIIGALSVCLIYIYYYKSGGDTLGYHHDAGVMIDLLFKSSGDFFKVWTSSLTNEIYSYFSNETEYPYYASDPNAFGVVRLIIPLELLAFKSYIVTSVLMATVSFSGLWRLYSMFSEIYPGLYKQFAVTILFVPSAVFWGSGLLKDSWTISAACWFCYAFYNLVIKRRNVVSSLIFLFVASFIMILIKPYIFITLLPGSILWGIWNRIVYIQNFMLKIFIVPIVFTAGIGIGLGIWMLVNKSLGEYSSLESILLKAKESSEDLKQAYYEGNSFDIGQFDPTLGGIMSKFPIATLSGLFRPFIWEVRNIVMLISALESLVILFFTFYVLLKNPVFSFKSLFSNPLVLFCMIFSIFFAFSVGLSTSNFGTLVRLRIPMLPFFLTGFYLIYYLSGQEERKRKGIYVPAS